MVQTQIISNYHTCQNEGLTFDNFNVCSSKLGMYEENCGLDKVMMSWGHDEYMYRMLKHNKSTLPEEAFYIIR
jgi:Myo-inositol oxygenase